MIFISWNRDACNAYLLKSVQFTDVGWHRLMKQYQIKKIKVGKEVKGKAGGQKKYRKNRKKVSNSRQKRHKLSFYVA